MDHRRVMYAYETARVLVPGPWYSSALAQKLESLLIRWSLVVCLESHHISKGCDQGVSAETAVPLMLVFGVKEINVEERAAIAWDNAACRPKTTSFLLVSLIPRYQCL